jgi:O-acetyl-ADP-ribose deacetylase (regulator of RNase III)
MFLYLISGLILIVGCINGPSRQPANGSAGNPTTKTAVDVKDKSAPPPLQASIPTVAATAGWTKTLAPLPVSVPDVLPRPNQVFYKAQKNIAAKIRSISVVYGDLLLESDTIVNAANSSLEGGGGIDGAIHKAAKVLGKDLLKEEAIAYKLLNKISSFPVGSAMVTHTYGLNSKIKMVVFTVGPQGASDPQKDRELYSAVYNSLLKANEYGANSIAIPAISTGIFGFPKDVAARLFFKAALQFFVDKPTTSIEEVRFTNFDKPTVEAMANGFLATFP